VIGKKYGEAVVKSKAVITNQTVTGN